LSFSHGFTLRVHNFEALGVILNGTNPSAQTTSSKGLATDVIRTEVLFFGVLFNSLESIRADILLVEVDNLVNELLIIQLLLD